MENLWPAFEKREITTPKSIFEEQIKFFNSLGTGLRASLSVGMNGSGDLTFTFRIQASALSGYTFTLFRASHHPASIYPVSIEDQIRESNYDAFSQEQLEKSLKDIFNSSELKSIIQNLIAQIYDDAF